MGSGLELYARRRDGDEFPVEIGPSPDAREAIAQQELAIGAMSRLLNALLDTSKLESASVRC